MKCPFQAHTIQTIKHWPGSVETVSGPTRRRVEADLVVEAVVLAVAVEQNPRHQSRVESQVSKGFIVGVVYF